MLTFKLKNQDGLEVSFDKLKAKYHYIVLYFYPKALTSGCTLQACSLRDSLGFFTKNKIGIFGISPDPVEKLKKFQEKEGLNFELLSDPDHTLADHFGAFGLKKMYGKEYEGIIRSTYILDSKGKLLFEMKKVNTKTHHSELQKFFQDLLKLY